MKRFRHYKKDTAIVLACFGSVVEQGRYLALQQQVQQAYPDYPVQLAFSSRMVIKALAKQGEHYVNLPQTLAQLDSEGYRRVVIASCYLFPTEEHGMTLATAQGFGQFSLSRMVVTPALLQQVKHTNTILQALSQRFPASDKVANLFISHGAPLLDNAGYSAVQYAEGLLHRLGENNFNCSLEGTYPFSTVRDALVKEISQAMPTVQRPTVRLVPLLLVSGNHYIKDLGVIAEDLGQAFTLEMAQPVQGDNFCLFDLPEITEVLISQISDEITKLG